MRSITFLCLLFLFSCSDSELVDLKNISHGAELYKNYCSNCHQMDGSGLAQLIPPLYQSDYLTENAGALPCIIKNGLKGKIRVGSNSYTLAMPAVRNLSREDVKDICVYVLQKFPKTPIVIADSVLKNTHKNCP